MNRIQCVANGLDASKRGAAKRQKEVAHAQA
jgi:hypothetical protein